MTDIDHFKSVNDEFGHAVGDEALTHFAELLSEDHGGVVVLLIADVVFTFADSGFAPWRNGLCHVHDCARRFAGRSIPCPTRPRADLPLPTRGADSPPS